MITTLMLVSCLWTNPGHDPYTGTVTDAINRFSIPAQDRAVLIDKIERRASDDKLYISKNAVWSSTMQFNSMMVMHFGENKLCWGVDRRAWDDEQVIEGEVYCSNGFCAGRPDACGNITELFSPKNSAYNQYGRALYPEILPSYHQVPEPPIIWLLSIGAAMACWRLRA